MTTANDVFKLFKEYEILSTMETHRGLYLEISLCADGSGSLRDETGHEVVIWRSLDEAAEWLSDAISNTKRNIYIFVGEA